LTQTEQTFAISISGEKSIGEYICDASANGERVQKSLNVYFAGKGESCVNSNYI